LCDFFAILAWQPEQTMPDMKTSQPPARKSWNTPELEELTVDLDAIASNQGNAVDNPGGNATKQS